MTNYYFKYYIALLIVAFSLYGDTISGDIINDTIWSDNVEISGNIKVNLGVTLTIEPGTSIKFLGLYKFIVEGTLLSVGNESDTITFFPLDSNVGWLGVKFDNGNEGAQGAMYQNDSSKIIYCKFIHGNASGEEKDAQGGAIYLNYFNKITISNSSFINCKAEMNGGAICCIESPIDLSNNYFENNNSSSKGGAVFKFRCNGFKFKNNIIKNNKAASDGGGLSIYDANHDSIINNIFEGNEGYHGGAIGGDTEPVIVNNNKFISNHARGVGGAVYFYSHTQMMYNNFFCNNKSDDRGGALFCHFGNPKVVNCIICNNEAVEGGASYFKHDANATFLNSTICNNKSLNNGGALYCYKSSPLFYNCIIYGNKIDTSNQVYLETDESDPNFEYSNIQGGKDNITGPGAYTNFTGKFENNIDNDTIFVAPTIDAGVLYNAMDADWSLYPNCLSINKGSTGFSGIPEKDIMGNDRIIGVNIDLGAIEFLGPTNNKLSINNHFSEEIVIRKSNNYVKFIIPYNENPFYYYSIYSLQGKIVYSSDIEMVKEVQELCWNGMNNSGKKVPLGFYIAVFKSSDNLSYKKFVFQ